MEDVKKASTVSEIITDLSKNRKNTTVGDIVDALEGRGLALLIAIFALPVAVPMPAPILGTILGLPVFFLSLQMLVMKEKIWLPERVLKKSLSPAMLVTATKYLQKIECVLHSRLGFMSRRFMQPIIGFLCVVFSLAMLLPFPLTNTVPGLGILLMSLGMFQRDGLFTLAGAIIGMAWISLLVIAGDEFVAFVRDLI